jgi:hypothetical protein
MIGKGWGALVALTVALTAALAAAVPASAQVPFEFVPGAQTFVQSGPGANVAGGHPDMTIDFKLVTDPTIGAGRVPQAPRTVVTDLPPGLVGDPKALDICPIDDVIGNEKVESAGRCPRRSAIGTAAIDATHPNGVLIPLQRRRVFRVAAAPNEVAAFATSVISVPIRIAVTVSPEGGYRIRATADNLTQSAMVRAFSITLWGVPADRQGPGTECDGFIFGASTFCLDFQPPGVGNPAITFGGPLAGAPRHPFMTNPSVCGAPLNVDLRIVPYGTVFAPITASMSAGTVSGCELQPFHGGADVTPASRAAGQPSGYTVGIDVAQNQDADGQAAAHVKDVEVTLPEGVAISPSSANGLAACSDAQLDINGDGDAQCPAASRIGTMTVESPVLDETLTGEAYVGTQLSQDPMSGEMYRLFLVVKGKGVLVKLQGGVKANPNTGQLTARFENNPQLPFNRIELKLADGERASLVNPTVCGSYDTNAGLLAWSGKAANLTASMAIDQGCGPRGFAPSLTAGTENPVAGGASTFSAVVARQDRSEDLRTLDNVTLPKGLLGHVSHVPLCGDGAADAGVCDVGSRIGHVQVAAGPGSSPVWVPQQGKSPASVSLAGPYKGAPYSLSVVVPAQAGPFDLGRIVVRSPLHIDRLTAQLSTSIDVSRVYDTNGRLDQVVAGAMPTVVKGIPLQVREVRVIVDRENFTVNPTSCQPASVGATLGSTAGQKANVASRFQVGECASLGFAPKLAMRLIGKRQTRTGTHPGLRAVLTQPDGQANIDSARVVMPKAIVLDPNNSTDPKLVCDYDTGQKGDCDAASTIGSAKASSPLLKKPLTGKVHLVQGIRFGPTGNRIRTTPSLLVKLRGEVAIDLYGRTTVRRGRLVTQFNDIPDARVAKFSLHIKGGKQGILVVTRTRKAKINLCAAGRQKANTRLNGQNGKRANFATGVKTPCGKKSKRNRKTGSKRS